MCGWLSCDSAWSAFSLCDNRSNAGHCGPVKLSHGNLFLYLFGILLFCTSTLSSTSLLVIWKGWMKRSNGNFFPLFCAAYQTYDLNACLILFSLESNPKQVMGWITFIQLYLIPEKNVFRIAFVVMEIYSILPPWKYCKLFFFLLASWLLRFWAWYRYEKLVVQVAVC